VALRIQILIIWIKTLSLAGTMRYGSGSDDLEELAAKSEKRWMMRKKETIKKGMPPSWDTPKGIDK